MKTFIKEFLIAFTALSVLAAAIMGLIKLMIFVCSKYGNEAGGIIILAVFLAFISAIIAASD